MQSFNTPTAELLQNLIQFNTVNPPGNERAVQEHLRRYLEQAGLECELAGAEHDRPNLIARLRGNGEGPRLGFLGHVDTVLANPAEWRHDPWSGKIHEGYLYGRGALDMKSQVAAEAVAIASLARQGWRPESGELIFMSVVDEETGGALGAKWLTEERPDLVECDFLINEGGGPVFPYEGQRYYGVCCAEKGVFRFTVSQRGVAAHASLPRMGDNALLKMAPVLQRFAERGAEYDLTDPVRAFIEGIGENPDDLPGLVERVSANDDRLAALLEPMLGATFAPTRIRASEKINVIPSLSELQVDCRVPPGLDETVARKRIEETLEGVDCEWEFREQIVGNSSAADTDFMRSIDTWVKDNDPGAKAVPTMLAGFTDSRWYRKAFPNCVAYGFFPQRHMDLYECSPLVHGANERIDVRDLGFATKFYYDIAKEVLGSGKAFTEMSGRDV